MRVPKMSEAEAMAFIAELPARTAKVATVLKSGAPHVAPVWVALENPMTVTYVHRAPGG